MDESILSRENLNLWIRILLNILTLVYLGSCANFGIQNLGFILTKKSIFPDFQKPIKWPGDWVWP